MSEQEIIEGNQLIAEFMEGIFEDGMVYLDNNVALCSEDCLYYHFSWDWLMPVVEKISNMDNVNFFSILLNRSSDIYLTKVDLNTFMENSFFSVFDDEKSNIIMVYKTVIKFIKWYKSCKKEK